MVPDKLETCLCGMWFKNFTKQCLVQINLTYSFLKGFAGHTDPPLEAAQHPGI